MADEHPARHAGSPRLESTCPCTCKELNRAQPPIPTGRPEDRFARDPHWETPPTNGTPQTTSAHSHVHAFRCPVRCVQKICQIVPRFPRDFIAQTAKLVSAAHSRARSSHRPLNGPFRLQYQPRPRATFSFAYGHPSGCPPPQIHHQRPLRNPPRNRRRLRN